MIEGYLYADGRRVETLEELADAKEVWVENCPALESLPSLPEAKGVGVWGCPALNTYAGNDSRGYEFYAAFAHDKWHVAAGCRFYTFDEARKHWGPGGDVRAGRVTVVHPTGETDVEIAERTGGRNTVLGTRYMRRVGKSRAGRLLDGREWNEMSRTE